MNTNKEETDRGTTNKIRQTGKARWFLLVLIIGAGIIAYIRFVYLQPTGSQTAGSGVETSGGRDLAAAPVGQGRPAEINPARPPVALAKTPVVVVRNPKIKDEAGNFVPLQLRRTVNRALATLFQTETAAEGLKKIIPPTLKVGLKIQCYRGDKDNVTHPELVAAVLYFLGESKMPENNIIVWDNDRGELEKAGYKFNRSGQGVRYLATGHKKPRGQPTEMIMGYAAPEITAGRVKTRLAALFTNLTNVTINIPVLKTHKFKDNIGINAAILNMYGVIEVRDDNMAVLYDNECDPAAADVAAIPQIKDRTKLIIMDALTPLYNGGPMDDSRYHLDYNGIIVGFDPVAVDTVGEKILQEIRAKKLGKSAPRLQTKYLATAGGSKYKLGVNELKRIELREIELE